MKNSFNDLIDVSVKAFKDGVLGKVNMNDLGVRELRYKLKDEDSDRIVFEQHNDYSDGVDFINSLYIEEFVIEKDGDISKLKGEPKITLANGNEFIAKEMKIGSNLRGKFAIDFMDVDDYEVVYSFFELKGATVTQKRGK